MMLQIKTNFLVNYTIVWRTKLQGRDSESREAWSMEHGFTANTSHIL